MSDIAISPAPARGPFSAATVIALVLVGVLAFAAMLGLGAYLPDLSPGAGNSPGHALSNAATGFNGIVRLARDTGREPQLVRDEKEWVAAGLLVVTPRSGAQDVSTLLDQRDYKPTLFVLPKWRTVKDPARLGWVRQAGLIGADDPERILAPGVQIRITRHPSGGARLVADDPKFAAATGFAPRPLQVMRGEDLEPLLSDGAGGIVLARVRDTHRYLLADPDLLDNRGMARLENARAALAMLDALQTPGVKHLGFDLVLNGLAARPNALKLAFQPPLLGVTLAVLAALALAAWQAFARFGPPAARARAIAFGKAALVDNAATLVRKAGREQRLGARYAALLREQAAARFGAPRRLQGAALDAYLDALGGTAFTALAAALEAASDRETLAARARALHNWLKEKSR